MQRVEPVQFLRGRRLYFRPAEEADLPRYQRWSSEADIRARMRLVFPRDMTWEQGWLANMPRANPPDRIHFAIVLNQNDEHIGGTTLGRFNWIDRRATSGTIIGARQHWGQGYATEAKWLLLKYVFLELGLRRLESDVLAFNEPSLRHLKANGFVEEGRCRAAAYRVGALRDEVLLSVTRAQFEASRAWARFEGGGDGVG